MKRNVYIFSIKERTAFGRVRKEKFVREDEQLPVLVMDLFIDELEFQRRISKINDDYIEDYIVYINNKRTENTHQDLASEFLREWLNDNNIEMVVERKNKDRNKNYTWTYSIEKQENEIDPTASEPELNLKMKVENKIIYECDMNYRNVSDITRLINSYPQAEIVLDDILTLYCQNIREFRIEIKRDTAIVITETQFEEIHYLFYQNDKYHKPIFNEKFMRVYELRNIKM